MKICVDLDGVLYEWSKTARYMLREYKGYPRDGAMGIESTSWDYLKDNLSSEDWKWLWSEGVTLGLFRYGHVVTGGQSGVRALRGAGHSVHIVTHRPASAVSDTIDWLSLFQKPEAGVVLDGIHIITDASPKSSVLGDILVDDKPENIEDWIGHGRHGILFSREWNQGEHQGFRVSGWPEVVRKVREINEYRSRHEDNGGRLPSPHGGAPAAGGRDSGGAGNPRGVYVDVEAAHAGWGPEAGAWREA